MHTHKHTQIQTQLVAKSFVKSISNKAKQTAQRLRTVGQRQPYVK